MERTFLHKYFPASRVAVVRREIYGIKQREGETLVNIGKDSTNSVHLVLNIKCKSIPPFNTFTME